MRTEKRNENNNQVYPAPCSSTALSRAFQAVGCGDFDVMKTHAELEKAKAKWKVQAQICDRAEMEIPTLSKVTDRTSLLMDLDSIPDLDLYGLLNASHLDFVHDICGIVRHMDRSTYPGKLTDCFVPRFCA